MSPEAVRAQIGMESYVRNSGIEPPLLHLVKLCASYINGCAHCVDTHSKDARAAGETEQRVYSVPVWRETPFYTPRERAALAFTEAVRRIGVAGVSDEMFDSVREHFSDKEVLDLTMAAITVNGWHRLAITFRVPVGSYVPKQRDSRP